MSEYTLHDLLDIKPTGYYSVRHVKRNTGEVCDDHTEWLVLEQSPSFYIVYAPGEGYAIKRKKDYEIVYPGVSP